MSTSMILAYMPTLSEWIRIILITALIVVLIYRNAGFVKEARKIKAKQAAKHEREQKLKERKDERLRQAQEAKKQQEAAKRKTEQELSSLLGGSGLTAKSAEVGGYRMWYLEGGPADGPTVLLLHGFVADKEIWIDLGKQLAESGFRVIAPDLPVFGQNAKTDKLKLDVMSQTKRIRALAHQIGATPAHVVGHSLGAMLAAAYAYGAADEILNLVMIEPLGVRVPYETELDQWLKQDRNPLFIANAAAFDNLLGFLCAQPPQIDETLKAYRAEQLAKYRNFQLQVWAETRTGDRANLLDLILPEVKKKTMVVGGKESKVVHPSTPEAISHVIPTSTSLVLEGCGHMPMLEKPQELGGHLVQFLQSA